MILRRIGWAIVVCWFVVTATFAMLVAIPTDPARAMLGPHATAETLAQVREHYLPRPRARGTLRLLHR